MLKYERIAYDIRKKIISGEYKPQDQLPLEKELEQEYGVSRITVKRAYDMLVDEGLVIKQRGRGTFVKDIEGEMSFLLQKSRQVSGFSSNYPQDKIKTHVLKFEVVQPSKQVCKKLNIEKDQWVYYFIRLRCKEKQPMVIEYTYIPIDLIQGITEEILEQSLYDYIAQELDLKIQSAHRVIYANVPDEFEKKHLELEPSEPAVFVDEVSYLSSGEAFSYTLNAHHYRFFEYLTIETNLL